MPTKRCFTLLLVLALCVLVLNVGCRRSAPVQNYSSVAPAAPSGVQMDLSKMRELIIRGGGVTNWKMVDDGPGKLLATQDTGKHSATVAITFDDKAYQINYVSSVNLRAKDGSIHPRYNRWVKILNDNISREITLAR